ncbi:GDSL-type esterase/lipase family protein [Pseudarthrobacter scleromae]|uniref:GDSL-type esterase/lipase family protein n=1 Tax=Pseudarthrobacter scleromae TaxID=158897 RepID=UPI003D0696A8
MKKDFDVLGRRSLLTAAGVALIGLAAGPARAATPVASVARKPQGCSAPSWVVAYAMPSSGTNAGYENQTLRVVTKPTFGGERVRVRISNALGDRPLTVDGSAVAVAGSGAEVTGPVSALTFDGQASVTIPAGQTVLSDPAALTVKAFESLAVSFYSRAQTGPATGHASVPLLSLPGFQGHMFAADGAHVTDTDGAAYGSRINEVRFVSGVEVYAPNDGAVVVLGDSITEGAGAFADLPYSITLARRLQGAADHGGPRLAVVNAGIAGNRLLRDGTGPSALARLDRDVLQHAGVRHVLMMEGTNDLGLFSLADEAEPINDLPALVEPPALAEFSAGYEQIRQRVQAAGARLSLSPITPFGDQFRPGPWSIAPSQVLRRHEINGWIRASDMYDRRFDFDHTLLNPLEPNWLAPQYDTGDNVHPNTAGHQQMANTIDLSLFDQCRCT